MWRILNSFAAEADDVLKPLARMGVGWGWRSPSEQGDAESRMLPMGAIGELTERWQQHGRGGAPGRGWAAIGCRRAPPNRNR